MVRWTTVAIVVGVQRRPHSHLRQIATMQNLNRTRQQERIVRIDWVLRHCHYPGLERIARELESASLSCSRPTIERDIAHMRDDMHAPIAVGVADVADSERMTGRRQYYYFYSDPTWQLGDVLVKKDDLIAISLARQLLKNVVGVPDAVELSATYDKLLGLADEGIRKEVEGQAFAPIVFASPSGPAVRPEVWRNVLQAIRQRKMLQIRYENRWDPKKKGVRRISPACIVNLLGRWYVLGTAQLQDDSLRQYDLARIRSATITKVTATPPKDIDVEEALKNTFGRFIGDPNVLVDVTLRFAPRVAPLIMDTSFHARQEREVQPDGSVNLTFPVTPVGADPSWRYHHVVSWILSWGADVEVLGPDELRQRVAEQVSRLSGMYRKGTGRSIVRLEENHGGKHARNE